MKKIAGLLSLILCLTTWFICPSAQAFERQQLWEITSPYLRFQGGTVSYTSPQKGDQSSLNDGHGERKFIKHIDFKDPYDAYAPNVVVYLTGIVQNNKFNNRLQINPINVTETGFDIEYKTWWDSRIKRIWSNWVAFGE